MGSANQNEVNLFEMYTRLIADKNAENEALQANIYKRRAANDHIERENDKLELAIEATEITLTDQERHFYEKMVSINSRIDIAAPLSNAKKVESAIRAESEFSQEAKAQAAKFCTNHVEVLKNEWVTMRNIVDGQMNAIQMADDRNAAMDAYEKGFEDKMREIDVANTAELARLDKLITIEQEHNMRNMTLLAKRGIDLTDLTTPANSLDRRSAEST